MVTTALRVPLALPPCPGCAGGGEVNGLVCRECGGSKRVRPRRRPLSWKRLAGRLATPAGALAGRALNWSRTVPGVGGAAAFTSGVSVVAHSAWHWLPVYGVALVIGGVFGLAMDRRLLCGGTRTGRSG